MSHATPSIVVVFLIEAAYLYVDRPTKSKPFHAPSFFQFAEWLLQRVYILFGESNTLMRPIFLGFINENLANAPDEKASMKQVYFNNTQLLEYETRNKHKQWAEKKAALKRRLMLRVRNKFEGTAEHDFNIQSSTTAVSIVMDVPTRRSSQPQKTAFNTCGRDEDMTDLASSQPSTIHEETPTSPRGVSSSGT